MMDTYTEEAARLKEDTKISCIIPAWNEGERISAVLDAIHNYPLFDEIIVIDDGSVDATFLVVEKYSKVKLLRHDQNKGKAAAILTGMKHSSGNIIVLLDSDLIGLNHENISRMIYLVINKEYDLTILDRAGDRSAIWGWTNCARFFGGERCFWKKDFLEIGIPERSRYLLEIMMNLHYINRNKKIRNIYCDNLYTVHQYQKFGLWKGYYNYFRMSVRIVKKATIPGFIKQIRMIEDDHRYFMEYRNLINRLNIGNYHSLKERFAILSRIGSLQKKFTFDLDLREKIPRWKEFQESIEGFKKNSMEKYTAVKEKASLTSHKVVSYFNR